MRRLFPTLPALPVVPASLAILALALSAAPGAAQTFGLRGGVTNTSASFEVQEGQPAMTVSSRSGSAFAVFLDIDSDGLLSFQTEVGYQTKGFGFQGETSGEMELGYVTLDGLFKVGAPLGIFRLGGLVGIGVAGKSKCEIDGEKCENVGAEVNGTDFSATVGAEAAVSLGTTFSIWADGRYAVGLANINKTEERFKDLKNKAWILTVGIGFGI